MKGTTIEWTATQNPDGTTTPGYTFNGWIGCSKVSLGCAHCYAEARDIRFNDGIHWGKGKPRQRTSDGNWREPLKWNRDAQTPGVRPRVFSASLSDWLDDEVPIEWLRDLLELIRQTPNLDWLLLTKRPENWRPRLAAVRALYGNLPMGFVTDWLKGTPPANVWMGTSVENQECFDRRVPDLLKIPAKIRFLSAEPLLGPIDLGMYSVNDAIPNIHWCIIGGESGSNARPFDIAWAQSLVAQCRDAGVAPFVKQLGANVWTNSDPLSFEMRRAEWPIDTEFRYATGNHTIHLKDRKGGDWDEWAPELRVREFPA